MGLIGLSVIILATSFTGVTDEHAIGKAFTEALPFTALLAVFFAVVAVIVDQQLFAPIIRYVLQAEADAQLSLFICLTACCRPSPTMCLSARSISMRPNLRCRAAR